MIGLVLRNLRFYAASHILVALGVAVGAAVLSGALIVGDSLRGSLRAKGERQLHGAKGVYAGARLIRESAFDGRAVPMVILQGSARHVPPKGTEHRTGHVTIYGLKDADRARFDLPSGVVLSNSFGAKLHTEAGSKIEFNLEKTSKVPRSSLLGKKNLDDVSSRSRATVAAVLPAGHPMNDFDLSPHPSPPLNAFVPLEFLQKELDIGPRVNALISFDVPAAELNGEWQQRLTLDDWQLKTVVAPVAEDAPARTYAAIQSEQLILDAAAVAAIERAADAMYLRHERTFTYLANAIVPGTAKVRNRDVDVPKLIPYSVVAALDPNAAPPLGPFFPGLKDDEIALVEWPESQLKDLKPGDAVTLAYFVPELEAASEGNQEAWATFRFAGYIPLAGPARDRALTPPFPGISDLPPDDAAPRKKRRSIRDWVAPFHVNYARVGPGDDAFWDQHQATPKAYITRAAGERLFSSRFGTTTSVRLAGAMPPAELLAKLKMELLKELDPDAGGFRFEDVQARLAGAAQGGTDFGAMLLAFSGLLILAALLLVGMLFRLALDRRAKQIGVLLATGWSPWQVRRTLMLESGIVAVVGAIVGIALGPLYAAGMLWALGELWPDSQIRETLKLYVKPAALGIGFVLTLVSAWLALRLGMRGLMKVPAPLLLRGETSMPVMGGKRIRPWIPLVVAPIGLALVIGGRWAPNADARAGAFFGGGGLLLLAGLLVFRVWLSCTHHAKPVGSIAALGLRNASRAPSRSLFTTALLSLAAFLLVAVESFRKRPDAEFAEATGGSGGFNLMLETDVPVFHAHEQKEFRADVLAELEREFQAAEEREPGGLSKTERLAAAEKTLTSTTILPFRLRSGDDASCLNLYQSGRPRVLGVPAELLGARRFAFASTMAETDEERANPWRLLDRTFPDGALPVIAEQNTAMWQLKTMVGGTLTMPDETGREQTMRIVATISDSPFQSELMMGDASFRKMYPHEEGFRVFLARTAPDQAEETATLLESGLRTAGAIVEPTAARVAAYQRVIGAYLSTFQLLGGLALLLGIFGYGVVIARNVRDRTGELALLRSLGYRSSDVAKAVFAENLLLLTLGLGLGVLAATVSVLPHAALGGRPFSLRLLAMLAAVALAGLAVAAGSTRRAGRSPILSALRNE